MANRMKLLQRPILWLCSLFFLVTPCVVRAQSNVPPNNDESARNFVRQFYDWYVPVANKDNPGPASDVALKYKSYVFSPVLFRALKEDSEASAKAKGDLVGLDFDPFLYSQDPDDRYGVGNATRDGGSYRVEVFGISSGKRRETPQVVAEVARRNGRWVFLNFYYVDSGGKSGDLLSELRQLAKDRQGLAK